MYLSQLLILFGLVILSGIFSGSETALVSVSQSKVDELVSKKARNSKILKKLKKDPHKLLITVLICNNIINVGASAYAAIVFTEIFGSSGLGIATGIMTFFILIFGEIAPKSFAHEHSTYFSLWIAKPIYALQFLLFPLVWLFDHIVDFFNKLVGGKKSFTVTEGELIAMLKIGEKEGSIEKKEKEFIENVLEFNDIQVKEVMTPRIAIEAMSSKITIQEAVEFFIKHSHSRIPIYENNLDNIIGIITLKEILKYYDTLSPNKQLKNLDISKPLEVPFSKKINKLFSEFQKKHIHIAIVIDEFGGVAGLVTLEDLLEEIVGEIADEFDKKEAPIEIKDNKTIIASGKTLMEYIDDFLKVKISRNERDTINTFITQHLHRFPQEGEVIKFPRAVITVLSMKKNLVDKVQIKKINKKLKDT